MMSIMPVLPKKQFVYNRILRKYFMKRYMFGILLVFALIVCSFQSAGADNFRPTWKTGDRWLVKAVYLSHMDKEKWSGPVFWEYEITGLEGEGREGSYIIEIRDRDGHLNLKTRLVYSADDLKLLSVEIEKKIRGKEYVKSMTFSSGDAPVVTEHTLTPYDSPVFPVVCPSLNEFSVKREVDGLKSVQIVRQESRFVSITDEVPELPIEGKLIEIKCTGEEGFYFVQYWEIGFPWPVYGENNNMKYWLVKE